MNPRIAELTERIRLLEGELELEASRRAAELLLTLDGTRVRFAAEMIAGQRALKTNVLRYLAGANPLTILTSPVIYAMVLPLAALDLAMTLYQTICFPIYGIAKVRRADYMVFDRARLAYLNAIEKLNCAYCSYGNGVIGYAREITGRTEQYWCPIKHARKVLGAHPHYADFSDFGDAEAYRADLAGLRRRLADLRGP